MSKKPKDDEHEDRSIPYTCDECGAKHGGSKSRDLCPDCYKKRHG